jgi:hypothetical protein
MGTPLPEVFAQLRHRLAGPLVALSNRKSLQLFLKAL